MQNERYSIAEMKDLESKVDKMPFYLLIVINLLVIIMFFTIMMFKVQENTEYVKDIIAQNEELIESLTE